MAFSDASIITLFVEFFVNDIFGHVFLSVIFLTMVILSILLFSRVPKIAISLFALAIISTLGKSGYVPVWISVLLWVGLGLLWGTMILRLIR